LHRNATAPAGCGPRPWARPDTPLLDAFGRYSRLRGVPPRRLRDPIPPSGSNSEL
jgi:hypothetical protein